MAVLRSLVRSGISRLANDIGVMRDRLWAADEKALGFVAKLAREEGELFLVLDAFRNDGQIEAARQPNKQKNLETLQRVANDLAGRGNRKIVLNDLWNNAKKVSISTNLRVKAS
jgi:hypothetical protein